MADTSTNVPVKKSAEPIPAPRPQRLRDEVNRLFDDFEVGLPRWASPRAFFGGGLMERTRVAMPAIDLTETDLTFEVTTELPGMSEKDVHVELVNGDLRIKGEKREEKEEKHKDYHVSERSYGSFERRVKLPDNVDADKIDASFNQGVLKVLLPKMAPSAAKKIEVKKA